MTTRHEGPPEQAFIDGKRARRMAMVDDMPHSLRELVHQYGLTVVKSFTDIGITNPRHIRHIVERVLDEFSPTRGSYSKQGPATNLNQVERT